MLITMWGPHTAFPAKHMLWMDFIDMAVKRIQECHPEGALQEIMQITKLPSWCWHVGIFAFVKPSDRGFITTLRHRTSQAKIGIPQRLVGKIHMDDVGCAGGWLLVDNAYYKTARLVGPGDVDMHVHEWFDPADLNEPDRANKL